MKITDLTKKQIEQIVAALESDGFENINVHEHYISFSKFPRDYEMYGLNLTGNFNNLDDDDSINIYFQETKFFEDKISPKNKILLDESLSTEKDDFLDLSGIYKTRHSTSIDQRSEKSDIEEAIEELPGWERISAVNLKDLNNYFTEFESTDLIHVLIHKKEHYILNNGKNNAYKVYEGSPTMLINILTEHPESFFEAQNLKNVANNIKLENSDL